MPLATVPPTHRAPRRSLRWLAALVLLAFGLGGGSATTMATAPLALTGIEVLVDEAPTAQVDTATPRRRRARLRPGLRRLVRSVATLRRPRFVADPARRSALTAGPPRWRGPPLAAA